MPYATRSDLVARFGISELTLIAPGEGPETTDDNRINIALLDASDEADTYLSERYKTPLGTPSNILIASVCDIARYRLYTNQSTEEVTDRYMKRIAYFKRVVSGKSGLGLPEDTTEETSLNAKYTTKGSADRIFSRDSLDGF
jgi:phage gp36-like protein